MHDIVLPAVAGFINFLRTDGIPAIMNFFKGLVVQASTFAISFLAAFDAVLAGLQAFFGAMALIPGPMQESFAKAHAVVSAFRPEVEKLKTTMESVRSTTVAFKVEVPSDRTTGEQGVLGVAAAMDRAAVPRSTAFTVRVPSDRLTGEQGVLGVAAAMERVQPKTVAVTANVPSGPTTGTLGNQLLEGSIGAVLNKSVTTTSNVPGSPVVGTQGNQALKGAIDQVRDKTTTTRSNAVGEAAVRSLKGAIDLVKDKTVTVSVVVKGAGAIPKFAAGGRVPTSGAFLVGEKGPELLSLDALGGFVTPAVKTRRLLNADPTRRAVAAGVGSAPAGGPMVIENHIEIGGEVVRVVRSEITARDRATKRTVLAGSGVTF
jgi:hypothetical protein